MLHGTRTFVLQDRDGQIGDDPLGLGWPRLSRRSGPSTRGCATAARVEFTRASDEEAVAAFHRLARSEGILPALESAHAVAEAIDGRRGCSRKRVILVNLSGRGDKDLDSVLAFATRPVDRRRARRPTGRTRTTSRERR